jgi:hypothetical protein
MAGLSIIGHHFSGNITFLKNILLIKLRDAMMDAYKGVFCCSLIAVVSLEGLQLCGGVRIVCIFLNLLSVIKTTVNLLPFP